MCRDRGDGGDARRRSSPASGCSRSPRRARGSSRDRARRASTRSPCSSPTRPDGFSAMHRLAIDEGWQWLDGAPAALLRLRPGGSGVLNYVGPQATPVPRAARHLDGRLHARCLEPPLLLVLARLPPRALRARVDATSSSGPTPRTRPRSRCSPATSRSGGCGERARHRGERWPRPCGGHRPGPRRPRRRRPLPRATSRGRRAWSTRCSGMGRQAVALHADLGVDDGDGPRCHLRRPPHAVPRRRRPGDRRRAQRLPPGPPRLG